MKKIVQILTVTVLAILTLSKISVYAISGSASLSYSGSLTPGNSITLNAGYHLSKRGTIQVRFISNNPGVIAINGNGVRVSSQALQSGSLAVSANVKSYGSATITLIVDEVNALDDPDDFGSIGPRSITINVNKPAPKPQPTPQPTPQPKPQSTPQFKPDSVAPPQQELKKPIDEKSSNERLNSLSVDQGKLTPEFNSEVSEYTVTLPKKTTKATITAKAQDSSATVSGAGEVAVKEGKNVQKIEVVAEDGTKRVYTVNLVVEEEVKTSIEVASKKLGVLSILPETLPKEFTPIEITVNDTKVKAIKKGNITLIYTVDEKGNKQWQYVVDGKYSPYEELKLNEKSFVVGVIDKDLPGMEKVWKKVLDKEILVYQYGDPALERFSVLPIVNEKNEVVLYQFDRVENTLQVFADNTQFNQEKIKTMQQEQQSLKQKIKNQQLMMIGLGSISLLLLLGGLIYMIKVKKSMK